MTTPSYSIPPELMTNSAEHRRRLALAIKSMTAGKLNVTLDVTLDANSATTTIYDARISYFSAIIPAMAMTANAAAAIAAGIWVSPQSNGEATVNHINDANTDKDIRFVIIG